MSFVAVDVQIHARSVLCKSLLRIGIENWNNPNDNGGSNKKYSDLEWLLSYRAYSNGVTHANILCDTILSM